MKFTVHLYVIVTPGGFPLPPLEHCACVVLSVSACQEEPVLTFITASRAPVVFFLVFIYLSASGPAAVIRIFH